MKSPRQAGPEQKMISPMCQVSVGRHETCTWVECTCWCHQAQKKEKGGGARSEEGKGILSK